MSSIIRRTLKLSGFLLLGCVSAGVLAAAVANLAPTIVSKPYPVAEVGQPYRYAVRATDPEGNEIAYSLVQGPGGMAYSSVEQALSWTPTSAQVGAQQVTARARDGWGASVDQTYSLRTVADFCEIYPITVPQSLVANVAVGQEFTLVPRGANAGNFGWLTWTGATDTPTLAGSLASPGNSYNYTNPANAADHLLEIGDWTQGATGSMNAWPVREQMDLLKTRDIVIPTWDATRASGADHDYRVVRFASVRLRQYDLSGPGAISFEFRGFKRCYNDVPKASDLTLSTPEDTSLPVSLQGSDPENDTLTYVVLGNPAHGTLSGTGANRTYTPDADFSGDDTFTYRVNDGEFDSNVATVLVHVTPVNDPPVALDRVASTAEDTPVAVTLAGNDPEHDPLSFSIVDGPTHGTLTGVGSTRTYVPSADWSGDDSFTYRTNDGALGSNVATVTVHVVAVNDAPLAENQTFVTDEDTTLPITLSGSDREQDPITFAVRQRPTHGELIGDGAHLEFRPSRDFFGTDSFTFVSRDGQLDSVEATVTINVREKNAAPSVTDLHLEAVAGTPLDFTLTGTDPDGDSVGFRPLGTPGHGVLSGLQPNLSYLADADFSGTVSFDYVATDGRLESTPATVTIVVTSANHPPRIVSSPGNFVDERATYNYDVDAVDTDAGDLLRYGLQQSPLGASIDSSTGVFGLPGQTSAVGSVRNLNLACRRTFDYEPLNVRVGWNWTGSNTLPLYNQIVSPPLVGQMTDDNGDGKINTLDNADVVIMAYDPTDRNDAVTHGVIRILDGRTGLEHRTIAHPSTLDGFSLLAMGDLDGDGVADIVAASRRPSVVAYRHDGTLLWEQTGVTGFPPYIKTPSIADLDGDGHPEVIFDRYVLDHLGNIRWQMNAYSGRNRADLAGIVSVADLDGDGAQEIIAGASAYRADGTQLWQNAPYGDGFTAIGNVVGDSRPEIALVRLGTVTLLSSTGTRIWGPIAIPFGGEGGAPTLADMDGDGELEIGVAGAYRYAVFNADGSLLWQSPTQDLTSRVTGSSVFDLDGDGNAEVLYNDEYNFRIFRGRDGKVLFQTRSTSGTAYEYPVIANIDADPAAEILVASNEFMQYTGRDPQPGTHGLAVFKSAGKPWMATRAIWNQHAYNIDNVNDDGTIPAQPVKSWLTHNTFRLNSFIDRNPGGLADLALFDLRLDASDSTALRVTARNRGLAPTQGATLVRFYAGSSRDGRLLGTVPLPILASDETIEVRLDHVDSSMLGDDLYAEIDEVQAVEECLETNNATQARVFHVRATDRAGQFDSQTFTVAVRDVNDAPSFVPTMAPTPRLGQMFIHRVKATDPDQGDGLLYSLVTAPDGMTIEPVSGELRWTPTAAQAGSFNVIVRVTDLRGLTATQNVALTVPANRAPTITSAPVLQAVAGEQYRYDIQAADADGDILSYAVAGAPANLYTNTGNGVMVWTPATIQVGSYPLTVTVTDGLGGMATQSYTLVVSAPVNDPPRFDTEPVTVVALGQRYRYDARATDPEGQAVAYFVQQGPSGLVVDSVTGTIVWQPRTEHIGAHEVELVATDALGLGVTQSFTLYVTQGVDTGNHPPAIRSTPTTVVELGEDYDYAITAEDIDGDPITLTLGAAPAGMALDGATLRWTPVAAQGGLQTVSVQASDGRGGLTTQTFSVLVSTSGTSGAGNHPPRITTDPLTLVALGQTYRYYPSATDPDGDVLTYSLLQSPDAMTVNAANGVLAWTPSATGTYQVALRVSDGRGGSSLQSFSIVVDTATAPPINHRPILLSSPVTQGKVGKVYCDTLEAFDADGDVLAYALTTRPDGAAINAATGRVCWTPERIGAFPLVARISDGQAWTDVGWTLQVVDGETPLGVHVVIAPERVIPGAPVTIDFEVTGPAGPVEQDAELNGTDVSLDDDGSTTITAPTDPGFYQLEVTVTDGVTTTTDTADLFVADPSDTTPPSVSLSSPAADARITAPTPVFGQVSGDGIARWSLSLLDKATNAMTPIAEGHAAVGPGALGTLDPTLLVNGHYTVVLQAWDASGNAALDARTVLIDGEMKLGHYSVTFEDVSIPMGGFPLRMTRTYDTRRRHERLDFGYGWSVDYQGLRVTESRTTGYSWTMLEERNGFFGNWCVRPNGDPIVAVTLPDGELMKFRAKATPECQYLTPQTDVRLEYEPLPGTDAKLTQTDYGNVRLASIAGSGVYNLIDLSDENLAPIDPKNYRLTLPDGTVYAITQGVGLRQVSDSEGHTLTFNRSGVKHSLGQELKFLRDGQGRIETVLLPDGKALRYTYLPTGDLEMAIDQGGDITSFAYLPTAPHYLKDIVDPRGVRVSRNEYDDDGRLVATIDADNHRIEYTHDLGNRTEVVKNRRGYASTYGYDEEGRISAESNALGETIRHKYDANGNELETIDPLNHKTTRTFDARGNVRTETNHLGETVTRTYNERNLVLTETDALNRLVTTNTYNPYNGKIVTTTNAAGEMASFGYDVLGGTGELTGITDPAGQRTRFELDLWGHRRKEIDDLGHVTDINVDFHGRVHGETRYRTRADGTVEALRTAYTLDDKDRVIATTHPDNTVTTTRYDGNDKVVESCDALQRCTVTTYLPRGQVGRVDYPDGTYETTGFDENGNTTQQRNRCGRVTKMRYDEADRLIETILPDATPGTDTDNPRIVNEYDAAGRIKATIDARRNRTEYGYDDANRRTTVKDALGRVTTTGYNAAGQRTSVTDALGHTTRFEYDGAGRLTTTIHPDDTVDLDDNPRSTVEYDKSGRKTAEIDEEGRRKELRYDGLGRLKQVLLPNPSSGLIDDGALITTYGYDEVGNKRTQTDALGRVTRWTFDAMGRERSRMLPLGQVETFGYDDAGQRVRHTDFNGVTTLYGYNRAGRLESIDYANDPDVVTTYTDSGQRESVTDGQGTTSYTYTARDQLEAVRYPDGNVIAYGYDAAGNKTFLRSPALEQSFRYDELNRLHEVDSRTLGGVVRTNRFEYDEVGNRRLRVAADGTSSTYAYDERNLLRTLDTRTGAGALLFAAVYSVDDSGLRVGIAESTAAGPLRAVGYAYDGVKRLQAEAIQRPGHSVHTTAYTYDEVGNRVRRDAAGVVTTYEVDANDRLLFEATGSDVTPRQYDDNGNMLRERHQGAWVSYGYDEANRLIRTENANGVAQVGYTADGIRNREVLNGVTTTWVIDANREYAQTLEEYRNSDIATVWHFGDDLMAQANADGGSVEERSLMTDGMGSVRQVTGAGGSVTDTFEYDAFGEELARTGSSDIDHRYRGEQLDPNTGFYNLRARWYAAELGRFTTLDRWSGVESDPITLHTYLYAGSEPLTTVDPSGNFSLAETNSAMSIRNTLANLQADSNFNLLDAALDPDNAARNVGIGLGIAVLGGAGYKLLKMLSGKARRFLKARRLRDLRGIDYEIYMSKLHGGQGGFQFKGRNFDGPDVEARFWFEAKSGGEWNRLMADPGELAKFKSDMGSRLLIAREAGKEYRLYSNSPIPDEVRTWLDKKGIPWYETLE